MAPSSRQRFDFAPAAGLGHPVDDQVTLDQAIAQLQAIRDHYGRGNMPFAIEDPLTGIPSPCQLGTQVVADPGHRHRIAGDDEVLVSVVKVYPSAKTERVAREA